MLFLRVAVLAVVFLVFGWIFYQAVSWIDGGSKPAKGPLAEATADEAGAAPKAERARKGKRPDKPAEPEKRAGEDAAERAAKPPEPAKPIDAAPVKEAKPKLEPPPVAPPPPKPEPPKPEKILSVAEAHELTEADFRMLKNLKSATSKNVQRSRTERSALPEAIAYIKVQSKVEPAVERKAERRTEAALNAIPWVQEVLTESTDSPAIKADSPSTKKASPSGKPKKLLHK